jgi:DNA-directed RNA polymerase
MLTILLCLENGVQHFAMVHDSFATHAGNTSVLQACIRDSFVEMYSGNILQKFHDEVSRQLSDNVKQKLPEPPEMSTFDLSLVKESQYFFA